MPNWVESTISVEGPEYEIKRFKSLIKRKDDGLVILESLYPIPEAYKNTHEGTNPVYVPSQISEQNGGCRTWYDWQLVHWGCKWGDCRTKMIRRSKTNVVYSTSFPWSLPEGAFLKISADFPSLVFDIDCDEEAGFFHGNIRFAAGETIEYNIEEGYRDSSDRE